MNAIHIANNDGVTDVNVYAEVFVQPQPLKTQALNLSLQVIETRKDSAVHVSLFFIFTCQTARDPKTPLPSSGSFGSSHSTANDNRLYRLLIHSS